jgi:hypothetical protein
MKLLEGRNSFHWKGMLASRLGYLVYCFGRRGECGSRVWVEREKFPRLGDAGSPTPTE